jgi:orotate phosphoribosyltransferase
MSLTEKTHYQLFDKELARELANDLLSIKAVILRPNHPMTWASGWNSPIYCDNRLTLRYPDIRKKISTGFQRIIESNFSESDVITGTATAGIPHAAWVAQSMNKPMAYVRSQAKAHGLGNQIEGGIEKGEKTVIIEDLVSTGGSALSVVEAVEFVGVEVLGIVSIFTYGFRQADDLFREKGLPFYSLTDYQTLIDVARENHQITDEELLILNDWRSHPDQWPL